MKRIFGSKWKFLVFSLRLQISKDNDYTFLGVASCFDDKKYTRACLYWERRIAALLTTFLVRNLTPLVNKIASTKV